MRTVVGVLPTIWKAQDVAHKLEFMGVARDDMEIVPEAMDKHEIRKVKLSKRNDAAAARAGALRGAGFGLVLGGLVLALPGVRPFVIGNVILTLCATALVGAVVTSVMVMIYGMGESHEEAALHDEAVIEKGVVLAAHVTEEAEPQVLAALSEQGAHDVHACADVSRMTWRAEGFLYEHPYPYDSAVKAREPAIPLK
jgi:hypothetical protein